MMMKGVIFVFMHGKVQNKQNHTLFYVIMRFPINKVEYKKYRDYLYESTISVSFIKGLP